MFLTDSQIKVKEWPVGVCRSGMAVWISMLMQQQGVYYIALHGNYAFYSLCCIYLTSSQRHC